MNSRVGVSPIANLHCGVFGSIDFKIWAAPHKWEPIYRHIGEPHRRAPRHREAVSNVVSTGIVTIPVMKKSGYKEHHAGAIETAASTGG